MSETFGKEYKLCSKKTIEGLFSDGKQLRAYPFTIYLKELANDANVPFQLVFSAPKRSFKRAHDRNYVKRIMKETFRKKKLILEDYLQKEQKQIALFVIYTQKQLPAYAETLVQVEKLMHKINGFLADEK